MFNPRRACALLLLAGFLLIGVQSTSAQERLCDPSFEDCRQPLLDLINRETVGIDVGFWFMLDARYSHAIISRWQAGVPVRILCDPRSEAAHGGRAIIDQLAAAGIPMRHKLQDGILHWKTMIFAGQNKVEFSGANFDPFSFVFVNPFVDYIDEVIYFTDDPSVVNSFKTKFDDLWVNTSAYGNFANINGPLTRKYPITPIDPALNFPPGIDFGGRSMNFFQEETRGIDAIMFRITNAPITDIVNNAASRGVTVRLLHEPDEYRNRNRVWDSYNVDRLYMAGVRIKQRKHAGVNHQKSAILYNQGLSIIGSSNWTGPSFNSQQEHNYFTTKPWIFQYLVNQFERKWNSPTEYEPFIPLGPQTPVVLSPSSGGTGQPTALTLTWEGGLWSHKYDVYFGTSPNPPLIATDVFTGTPDTLSETFAVSGLRPGTTYFWRILGKTMANMAETGQIWSFTTGGSPPAPSPTTPTVTGVSPSPGSGGGGAFVTITGTNFAPGAKVSFGYVPATNVTFVNATTVTATVPAHAAGAVDVTVTNLNGEIGTLAGGYTYAPVSVPTAPKISVVTPSSGPSGGGTSIKITGMRFASGATVTFGGVPATNVVVMSASYIMPGQSPAITCTAPPNAASTVDVVVTNPDGQSSTFRNGYTYMSAPPQPPVVSSVSPNSGTSAGGTPVTVTGSNFTYGAVVKFGGVLATNIIVVNPTTITASAPLHAAGPVDVVVTNYDNQSATLPGAFTYTQQETLPAPVVSSVSPDSGSTGGGTPVTISGNNFSSGASVRFGGIFATNVSVTSSTTITATTPPRSAGIVDVVVTNTDGQSGTRFGGYTYVAPPPPVANSLSPNTGQTTGGTAVTITGVDFAPGAAVKFGGVAATNVSVVSGTTITATTPAHAAGAVDVVVTNTDGQSDTLPAAFTFTTPPPPPAGTLLADDFNGANIDTTKWSAFIFSGTRDASVPMSQSGGQLRIGPLKQNTSGSSYNGITSVSRYNFTGAYCYVMLAQSAATNTAAQPMLTVGVDTNNYYRYYVEAGTLYCLKRVGGAKATLLSVAYNATDHKYLRIRHDSSSGQVVFETAPDSGGLPGAWTQLYSEAWNTSQVPLGSMLFELKAGTWQAEANAPGTVIFDNFKAAQTNTSAPSPSVFGVSPNTGQTTGGTAVTITGADFASGAAVSFGGAAATNVSVASSTTITAVTPAHAAGAVDVVVTNSDAQSGTLAGGFTYTSSQPPPNQPPQVSISATPTSGVEPLTVSFTANASDPDGQIVSYSWTFGDGQTSTQQAPSHVYQALGTYTARLTVTDNAGATASASVVINVQSENNDIVLYASEAAVIVGAWQVVNDQTAAGGARMWNPDAGVPKVPSVNQATSYFEMTFDAQAGVQYHLWFRMKAQNNSFTNDSVFVQFSDSLNSSGSPAYRIGTNSSMIVILEDCNGMGMQEWGWNDDVYCGMGTTLSFATSGTQRIRVFAREDGMSIDQIVLSPGTFLNTSPGALKNDATILPKP